MSIELKITDRENVAFPIVIKDNKGNEIYKQWKDGNWSERTYDDNGNEIYRQVESGFWWEWTYDDNNNCLTCKDSNGFHYIKGKEVTKREYEAFINNKEQMSNNKQQTKEEKINRIKMIIELKANKTFLSILADFRLYKVHCMTIYDNQIEDECELASYWLNVELNEQ